MWRGRLCRREKRRHWLLSRAEAVRGAVKTMRLVTFENQGVQEIGALTEAGSKIIRLQAAEQLRGGEANPHLQTMLTFLQGGSASREAAQRTIEFAMLHPPERE